MNGLRMAALAVTAALAAGAITPLLSPGAGHAAVPTAARATTTGDGWSRTKRVTRVHYNFGATTPITDSDTVTVRVDKHTDLQSRERVDVSWSGAWPTNGRVGNPYGETGLDQEYPVVILECRGVDDPHAPARKQVSPKTCWTNTVSERSQSDLAERSSWRDDRYATAADKAQISGIAPSQLPKDCPPTQPTTAYHYTPFVAADGTVYAACDSAHMPPEAAVGSVDPPNEIYAYTADDGRGSAQFEVRTDVENASLGCSHTVPCTLEVIPIMGLSCADNDAWCNKTGAQPPTNDGTTGAEPAVSPLYWWSPSNWRNRFSVPLTFALPASTCSLLSTGKPVPFYGSELLSQAALQWAPAYCLNKNRFNWQSNTMPDDAAFALMQNGSAIAAEVSARVTGNGTDDTGVGYAPTAVSGFGIAFDIDDPATGLPVTSLRLNARLLAKLLTESYPADQYGAKRPGLGKNPWSLQQDPEFLRLNPGLDVPEGRTPSEAAATLLALSTGSGVMEQLTAYIASDPDALAFIKGKPDPWGMRVNPAYRGVDVPTSTWPLLDGWTPSNTGNTCLDDNPAPWLPKIAAPVNNLRLIAQAMLFNWPNVNTVCDRDVASGLWKLGRVDRQSIGQRFMLGLVTLGDAKRYGLPVAKLQAAPHHYVGATDAGLSAALKLATQTKTQAKAGRPWVLDQQEVRKSTTAYPGTMVVYTAAKTGPVRHLQDGQVVSRSPGLDPVSAQRVAQFIRVSTSQGQVPGRGNGQLPDGYLPITAKGATAPLYAQARRVADAVAAQATVTVGAVGGPTTTPSSSPSPADTTPRDSPSDMASATPDAAPTAPAPSAGASPSVDAPPTTPVAAPERAAAAPSVKTSPLGSALGAGVLPVLLAIGLAAAAGTALARVILRRRGVR